MSAPRESDVYLLLQERDGSWTRNPNCAAKDAVALTRKYRTQAILFDEANSVVVGVYRHGVEVAP